MNDSVMGGDSTGTFEVEDSAGVMDGHVAIVPFLKAPGFIKAETTAGETWPDISSCTGLRLSVRTTDEYTGYRVSFGHQKPPNGFPYSYGYKTDLHVPSGSSTDTEMEDVVLNFKSFSYDWDAATGDQKTTCAENSDNCPSEEALQDIYSIALWAEGAEGDARLEVGSIHAVGCDSSRNNNSNSKGGETKSSELYIAPRKEKPSRVASGGDEIIIENFSDPVLHWDALNDPVMGGQSDGSVSIQDGVASFTGHVKIVPFLQAPGFITMETRGGIYPDVSSCNALKLVLRAEDAYSGYYVSFGTARAEGARYAQGFKTPFDAPVEDGFSSVVLPFSSFSNDWDDATGHVKVSCKVDSLYCPDVKTLKNFGTMSLWGEGVAGTVDLRIQSISAVGCASSTSDGQVPSSYGTVVATTRTESATSSTNFSVISVTAMIGFAVVGTILATTISVGYHRYHLSASKDQYEQVGDDLRLDVEEPPILYEIS